MKQLDEVGTTLPTPRQSTAEPPPRAVSPPTASEPSLRPAEEASAGRRLARVFEQLAGVLAPGKWRPYLRPGESAHDGRGCGR